LDFLFRPFTGAGFILKDNVEEIWFQKNGKFQMPVHTAKAGLAKQACQI